MKNTIRATVTGFLLLLATVGAADTGTDSRQSLTSQGQGITRGSVGDGKASFDEYAPLRTLKSGDTRSQSASFGGSSGPTVRTGDPNFWFYSADVILFNDFDHDGYYYGIDLAFDADTSYAVADVYAVLYLSYEYGPWEEYAATDDFSLYGSSGTDEYIVETELVSGYPTGSYDILIELYDAWDGSYLASIGPADTSELAILPLEDSTRDVASTGGPYVVVNSGGGSFGVLLLLGLLAVRMTLRSRAVPTRAWLP
jgi:hypothetical protein